MNISQSELIKAIHRSQHCQRNWDLSKQIPNEDMEVLVTAATQCPSKQNIAFYKTHFITKRDVIEAIHAMTDGFTMGPNKSVTNSQTLANLLIVFEKHNYLDTIKDDPIFRNDQSQVYKVTGKLDPVSQEILKRDTEMAVGVAAGYLNVTASIMGYSTGCCACFDTDGIKKLLNLENDPVLLMGIGFKNSEMNRRVHHMDHDFVFPTKQKQPIPTNFIV